MRDPDVIIWENGCPATPEDYRSRLDDTYCLKTDREGRILRYIFSDVIAEVYYDKYGHTWAIRGEAIEAGPIDERDPEATNLQLNIALQGLPTVYKAEIVRSRLDDDPRR